MPRASEFQTRCRPPRQIRFEPMADPRPSLVAPALPRPQAQQRDGLLNVGEGIERTARFAMLLAIGEQLPFGKHHIRLIHGESIGEPIAHEDDGMLSSSEAPKQRRFARAAPMLARRGRMREGGYQAAAFEPQGA